MATLHEIIEFIKERTGARNVQPETDIHFDLRVDGDDFQELISEYSSRFGVDMKGFLWYFHCGEEGQNIGGFFFAPPNRRVDRISVTPNMLLRFSKSGIWNIKYPEHKLPEKRYDMIFNRVFGIITTTGMTILLILKYLK